MDKVKIPKELADEIETIRKCARFTNKQIIAAKAREDKPFNDQYKALNDVDFDLLVKALVNGYQVAKTPEEEVRDYYNSFTIQFNKNVVRETLNRLGITIEGVND